MMALGFAARIYIWRNAYVYRPNGAFVRDLRDLRDIPLTRTLHRDANAPR